MVISKQIRGLFKGSEYGEPTTNWIKVERALETDKWKLENAALLWL